ncbi:hypothetical protein Pan181_35170 [Aeoliella mucimassa]|uniref:Uncharacterized protein n=2 Tax=Aeoliella mucimassa TaxID=2527972 RepID=A0A518ARF4_9BACT|nr:hypothetical protein Pan181_35170 [Aeoliella mucimassa]
MSLSDCLRSLLLGPLFFVVVCFHIIDECNAEQEDAPPAEKQEEPTSTDENEEGASEELDKIRIRKGEEYYVNLAKLGDKSELYSQIMKLYRNKLIDGIDDPDDVQMVLNACAWMAEAPTVPNIRALALRVDLQHQGGFSYAGGLQDLARIMIGRTQMKYPCVKSICKMGEPAISTLRDFLATTSSLSDEQIELLVYCILEIRDHGLDGQSVGVLDKEDRDRQMQLVKDAAKSSTLPASEIAQRLSTVSYFMEEIDLTFYNSMGISPEGTAPPARSVVFPQKATE